MNCFFFWNHDWDKWVDITITYTYPKKSLTVNKEGQIRICKKCGKKQKREV